MNKAYERVKWMLAKDDVAFDITDEQFIKLVDKFCEDNDFIIENWYLDYLNPRINDIIMFDDFTILIEGYEDFKERINELGGLKSYYEYEESFYV